MINKKYEYGSVYSLSKKIEQNNETLEIGTPVRLIEKLTNMTIIVEDYKGKEWKINEDDIWHEKIEKVPKKLLIYKLANIFDSYNKLLTTIDIGLGTIGMCIGLLFYAINNTSFRVPIVMITIGVVMFTIGCVITTFPIPIPVNTACFGNNQNIEELKILLNNDEVKPRIGCLPKEMPQGEEYKDFYFSDNYIGNLSTIAYDYLKESGKPGECVPILNDENIVIGLRVILYAYDPTLNYKEV